MFLSAVLTNLLGPEGFLALFCFCYCYVYSYRRTSIKGHIWSGYYSTGQKKSSESRSGGRAKDITTMVLASMVLKKTVADYERVEPRFTAERSPEYWTGWALAYYQWHTGISFAAIVSLVPVADIRALYRPYHEMDIRHFTDRMNELCTQQKRETSLKRFRLSAGLTQKELAAKSGISMRTIQQFEQRQKSINNAQINKLLPLSRVLHCEIETLLEPADFIASAARQPE